jgi:undecaprenyl-phosphate 4-deoxy-4-formamido-L-arabinose transferase
MTNSCGKAAIRGGLSVILGPLSFLDEEGVKSGHACSVVVPVYRGEHTLDSLIEELTPLTDVQHTPAGRSWRVDEVILVHDAGPDRSDVVMRRLASDHHFVRCVWLSRNFGQHAATLAGMSSTGSEWIVTLDEDGQFDPRDIGRMLDVALDHRAQLVYASPTNSPPHGLLRNFSSNLAKGALTRLLASSNLPRFSSFRLMLGDIGRGVAAYMGSGVYLDVALTWVFGRIETCPVTFRQEYDGRSGYSYRSLFSHFWRLVISAGTRPLRLVSLMGAATTIGGVVLALFLVIRRALGHVTVQGYTSLMVVLLLLGGAILFSLGIIAEYVGAAVRMAMGKPLYLITSDPRTGPLHREDSSEAEQVTGG